jgi:hypothetical protein
VLEVCLLEARPCHKCKRASPQAVDAMREVGIDLVGIQPIKPTDDLISGNGVRALRCGERELSCVPRAAAACLPDSLVTAC